MAALGFTLSRLPVTTLELLQTLGDGGREGGRHV